MTEYKISNSVATQSTVGSYQNRTRITGPSLAPRTAQLDITASSDSAEQPAHAN